MGVKLVKIEKFFGKFELAPALKYSAVGQAFCWFLHAIFVSASCATGLTVWNWLWTICSIIGFILASLLGMFLNVILGLITCLALFASGDKECALSGIWLFILIVFLTYYWIAVASHYIDIQAEEATQSSHGPTIQINL